jgi:hypothetical protein
MRPKIGKNRDFGVHFGANLRMQISSFWPFSKNAAFVFNKIVASLVLKNNLFFLPPAFPFRLAFRIALRRRLARTTGSM